MSLRALFTLAAVALIAAGAALTLATDSDPQTDRARRMADAPQSDAAAPSAVEGQPNQSFAIIPRKAPGGEFLLDPTDTYSRSGKCCACIYQCPDGGHIAYYVPENPAGGYLTECQRNKDCRDLVTQCPLSFEHPARGTCVLKKYKHNVTQPRCAQAICYTVPL